MSKIVNCSKSLLFQIERTELRGMMGWIHLWVTVAYHRCGLNRRIGLHLEVIDRTTPTTNYFIHIQDYVFMWVITVHEFMNKVADTQQTPSAGLPNAQLRIFPY